MFSQRLRVLIARLVVLVFDATPHHFRSPAPINPQILHRIWEPQSMGLRRPSCAGMDEHADFSSLRALRSASTFSTSRSKVWWIACLVGFSRPERVEVNRSIRFR
jgi:hypothetical protein